MRSIIFIFFVVLVLSSCKSSRNWDMSEVPDSIPVEIVEVEVECESQWTASQIDSLRTDMTAIADIKFGMSQFEFNKKSKSFLSTHPKLGNLKIASFRGYFYKDSLAGIEIISVQQDAIRNSPNSFYGWEDLIKQKYGSYGCEPSVFGVHANKNNVVSASAKQYSFQRSKEISEYISSGYETPMKIIFVTDFSAENHPVKDLRALFENGFSKIRYKTYLPDITFKNEFEGWMYTSEAFESIKSKNGMQLYDRMNREIEDTREDRLSPKVRIYQKYYDQIREEANINILSHNRKVKDSNTYSIIRIIFKPHREMYYQDLEDQDEQQKLQNIKDLELI